MASLPLPEFTRFLNLSQEELEIEASTRATVTAQLKQRERQFLAQRADLRAKQTTIPPPANDAQITAELNSLADDILKNEEELARNDAIVMLIAKLRTGGSPAPQPAGSSTAPPPPAQAASSLPPATQFRQILGKIPEYKVADDFDVFMSRFETYCTLNRISDEQQTKLLLDSAFSEEARLRASEISALQEPFKSDSFSAYTQRLRERFYPQAKSTLYKNTYDTIKQKASQSVTDYCSAKFSSYRRAYLGYPFQFFVRTMVQHLHNEDLRSEVLRHAGHLESSVVTEMVIQQRLYGELMNVVNSALDLCRRTSSSTAEAMDRNGLRVEGKETLTSLSSASTSSSSIAQLGAEDEDSFDWADEEEGDDIYVAEEMEREEFGLSEEEINYCYLNESEAQSQFWERQASAEEIQQMQASPTGKRCHECNSPSHLVRSCPTRLRLVQSRTHQMLSQSGRAPYPPSRGGFGSRGNQGWRTRGGGGRRGAWRGRGRGSSWGSAPRAGHLPQGFQNPYQPGQPASRMGPPTSDFPGHRSFR